MLKALVACDASKSPVGLWQIADTARRSSPPASSLGLAHQTMFGLPLLLDGWNANANARCRRRQVESSTLDRCRSSAVDRKRVAGIGVAPVAEKMMKRRCLTWMPVGPATSP